MIPGAAVAVLHLALAAAAGAAAPVAPTAAEGGDDQAAARAAAVAEANQKATQDLESAVTELRRQIEAMRTAREASDDLRRRLDALEARLAAAGEGPAAGGAAPAAPAAPAAEAEVEIGADDGEAGAALLTPRLHLAPRADVARVDGVPPERASAAAALALRWAQLGVEGHVLARAFEYRAELELAGTTPAVLDTFAQLRLGVPFGQVGIRAGRFRVPYGYEPSDLLDGRGLTLTDLAPASAAFGLGRDVGLMAIAQLFAGRLQARLAVVEGGAAELGGAPAALGFGARLLAAPLGKLPAFEGDLHRHDPPLVLLGGSIYTERRATDIVARQGIDPRLAFGPLADADGDGRIDGVRVVQAAGELRAVWRGAALSGEYFHRWERPDAGGGPSRWSNGVYGQASVIVLAAPRPAVRPRALEVAVRVGRTNQPLYGVTAAERAAAGERRDEQAVALNAYVRGQSVKLQLEYAHVVDTAVRTGPPGSGAPPFDRGAHRLRLQAHLAF